MKKLPWVLVALLSFAFALSIHDNVKYSSYDKTYTDTATYIDTIPYYKPVPKDSVVIRYKYIAIPNTGKDTANCIQPNINVIESTEDSTTIAIPITQSKYEGDEYRAWISGYNARLDSIFVFPRTTTVTKIQNRKPNRWGIGIQTGIGLYGNKISPYIGIGISYNILTW